MASGSGAQLELALGPYVNRNLFSDHFLRERLPAWPEFADTDPVPLLEDLADLWTAERPGLRRANEAQTEERFIKPVLTRLGFAFTVQAAVSAAGGHRQPDYALFATESDRSEAEAGRSADRYRTAVGVCDAKKFDRPLASILWRAPTVSASTPSSTPARSAYPS